MRIGTKSVLYGAHAWFLHPFFVAIAWTRLYGFPWKIQLWAAFMLHDIGYVGRPNMDGPEGKEHPILGARIMARLFGPEWGEFCLLHSRYYARRLHKRYSRLCVADKYSLTLTPWWLYLPMVWATGELREYQTAAKYRERPFPTTPKAWWRAVQADMRKWCLIHKNADTDDQWPNGFDPKDVPMSKLPGYLDGGYEPSRYKVTKADGTINPEAKYLVFRYDGHHDPHAIHAALMYAASVTAENPVLAEGIYEAVRQESGLSRADFWEKYKTFIWGTQSLMPKSQITGQGIAFALEMEKQPR